jgi:hypothetical protein
MDDEDRNRAGLLCVKSFFAKGVANYAVQPGKPAPQPASFELITVGERLTYTVSVTD